jgi:hypothetical protein
MSTSIKYSPELLDTVAATLSGYWSTLKTEHTDNRRTDDRRGITNEYLLEHYSINLENLQAILATHHPELLL